MQLVAAGLGGALAGLAAAEIASGFGAVGGRWFGLFATAILGSWAGLVAPSPILAALSVVLAGALTALVLVDVRRLRLPDALTLPLLAGGLAIGLLDLGPPPGLADRLAGAAVGFGALLLIRWGFRRLRGRDGLGLGDAKLLAAAGAWLGWAALPWVVLLASGFGLLIAVLAFARRGRAALAEPIAFGPALCLAFWLTWLYGAPAAA